MNSLGLELFAEFEKIVQDVETNPAIASVVLISAKPGCFVAGADISMIEKCKTAAECTKLSHNGQLLMDRMENVSQSASGLHFSSSIHLFSFHFVCSPEGISLIACAHSTQHTAQCT